MSGAGWAFGSALGAFAVVILGLVIADSGSSASTSPPGPSPNPSPTPPKLPPPPPPAIPAKWQRLTPGGLVSAYTIPAGATIAVTMADGAASRALMTAYQAVPGAHWTVVAGGTPRPSDWPSDDPENALALRGFGAIPMALSIPAESVLEVWQLVPAPEVGGVASRGGAGDQQTTTVQVAPGAATMHA